MRNILPKIPKRL